MSRETRQRRLPLTVGLLALLLVLCLGGVAGVLVLRDDEAALDGNAIVYGLTLNPSGFDPHRNASSELGIPFFSVYDTLVYRHPQTPDFVPGLAERWEMTPDGLAWTFYLRQDVTFHDGTPFDANAVAATLDRITNPELRSQKAIFLLGPYTGYTIVDPYTITLHLAEPYAPLLDALSQVYLGIPSPAALAATTNNSYQWNQVGTGPYRLHEFVPGDHITLKRNTDYAWGPVFYAPVTDQSIDTIEFRFFEDAATRSLALQSGEVDMIGELLPTDAELLVGNTAIQIYRVPIPGMPQQMFINSQRAPTDTLAVRQALIYATNRTAIADAVFQGESPVAYGPLTSSTPFYDPEVTTFYPFDPDFARSLLQGIGYEDPDDDGILERDGQPLRLTLVFTPWNQMSDVAVLIQSQWRTVGIDLELRQVPDFPSLVAEAEAGEYHLIAMNDVAVDPSLLNRFYLSTGADNWSGIADPELDGWLLEATRQSSPELRANLYKAVQMRIMEQAVVLPLREFVNINGATADLDGVVFSAQGWWPLLRNLQLTR